MIAALLQIAAAFLPFVVDWLSEDARKGRENAAFDKALAKGNADDIAALLSARVDSVRGN